MNLLRSIFVLACLVSITATAQVPVVNTLADLLALPVSSARARVQADIDVRRLDSSTEWNGPRRWTWNHTNALSTNLYPNFRVLRESTYLAPGSTGRWEHVISAETLAGFHGVKGGYDSGDKARLQAAADMAVASGLYDLVLPAGIYQVDGLRLDGLRLRGTRSGVLRANNGTILAHSQSPTNHAVILTDTSTVRKPSLEDLLIVGVGGLGTPNKVPITAVTSRTNISVALTNGPTSQLATNQQHPIQWCMFYTGDGFYLGASPVVNIVTNGANLDISLLPHHDSYAVRSGTTNLLTTAEQLVWAPVSGSTPRTDPATAGWCGIYIEPGFAPRISNVMVDKFHCGIYWNDDGLTINPVFDGFVLAHHCEFAGFASRHPFDASDWIVNGTAGVFGSYTAPFASVAGLPTITETNSIDLVKLRNTTWAYYNALQVASIDYAWADQCVGGIYQASSSFGMFDKLFIDNAVRYGIFFIHGYDPLSGGGFFRSDKTVLRAPTLGSDPTYTFLTDKTAVRVNGALAGSTTPAVVSLGTVEISSISGGPKWDIGFSVKSGQSHKVTADRGPNTSGATLLYDDQPVIFGVPATTAAEAVVGQYTSATNQINLAVSGQRVMNIDTDVTFDVPLALGTDLTIGSADNPTLEWGSSTDGALWVDNSVVNIRGNSNPAFRAHAAASEPSYKGRRNNGTRASPTAVPTANAVVHLDAEAYDGSAYNTIARASFFTDGTQSAGNRGSYFNVAITKTNTTSRINAFQVMTPAGGNTNDLYILVMKGDGTLYRLGVTNLNGAAGIYIPGLTPP